MSYVPANRVQSRGTVFSVTFIITIEQLQIFFLTRMLEDKFFRSNKCRRDCTPTYLSSWSRCWWWSRRWEEPVQSINPKPWLTSWPLSPKNDAQKPLRVKQPLTPFIYRWRATGTFSPKSTTPGDHKLQHWRSTWRPVTPPPPLPHLWCLIHAHTSATIGQ